MSDLLAIAGTLAWGAVTIGAFFQGVTRAQDADLGGVRAFGALVLLALILIVTNGAAFLLTAALRYCEHCKGQGVRVGDVVALCLLLLPSALVWIVLARRSNSESKRRWD